MTLRFRISSSSIQFQNTKIIYFSYHRNSFGEFKRDSKAIYISDQNLNVISTVILYSHKSLEYSVTFKCLIQIANNVILIEDVDGFWIPSKISDGKKTDDIEISK